VSLWGGFLYADHLARWCGLLTASVSLVCAVYARRLPARRTSAAGRSAATIPQHFPIRKYYTPDSLVRNLHVPGRAGRNLGVMWVAIEATRSPPVFLVTFYGSVPYVEPPL